MTAFNIHRLTHTYINERTNSGVQWQISGIKEKANVHSEDNVEALEFD